MCCWDGRRPHAVICLRLLPSTPVAAAVGLHAAALLLSTSAMILLDAAQVHQLQADVGPFPADYRDGLCIVQASHLPCFRLPAEPEMYQLMSGPKQQGVDRAGRPVVVTHRWGLGGSIIESALRRHCVSSGEDGRLPLGVYVSRGAGLLPQLTFARQARRLCCLLLHACVPAA